MVDAYIHPVAFALGFLMHVLEGILQHPHFNDTSFVVVNPFIDLLLQHWGVTLEEIEKARDLLGKFLKDPEQRWGNAYKEAAVQFARSTFGRKRMWLTHIYAVLVFQGLLLEGDVDDSSKLFVYHQGQLLGMSDNDIDAAAAKGAGLGIAAALMVKNGGG